MHRHSAWIGALLSLVVCPAVAASEPHLTLERTSRRLSQPGDPIWLLSLQLNQDTAVHFDAVSGRAHRQTADRHQTGSRAPLPPGIYSVGDVEDLGPTDPAELGPIWIGIEPQFITGRGHLGIHLDPSANRNADSGTLGCIGLIDRQSMQDLAALVRQQGVRALVVKD